MKRLLAVLALIAFGAVMVVAQPGGSFEIVGGGEEGLRGALRFLAGDGRPGDTVLYVGELPEELAVDLPEIEGVTLIGALEQEEFGTEIWLETEMLPADVIDAYAEALEDEWQAVDAPFGSPGGFVTEQRSNSLFCPIDEDAEAAINVSALLRPNDVTAVRFTINTEGGRNLPPVCDEDFDPRRGFAGPDPYMLVPQLVTPDEIDVQRNSQTFGGGGGPGNASASTSVVLVSDGGASDIAPLYEVQLEAAGWEQTSGSADENAAWSNWTLEDEDGNQWSGLFTLTSLGPGSNEFYAMLRVAEVDEATGAD